MVPVGTRLRRMKQRLNLHSESILNKIPETPLWLLKTVNYCLEGAITPKQNSSTPQLKQNFLSHLAKHSDTRHSYTDGSNIFLKISKGID